MTGKLKWVACALGMVLVPFLVQTVYLVLAGNGAHRTEWGDLLSVVVAIFAGMAFLTPLPLGLSKITVAVAYFFVIGALLAVYAVNFVCGYYHDCL